MSAKHTYIEYIKGVLEKRYDLAKYSMCVQFIADMLREFGEELDDKDFINSLYLCEDYFLNKNISPQLRFRTAYLDFQSGQATHKQVLQRIIRATNLELDWIEEFTGYSFWIAEVRSSNG